ncbi:MAG: hypothetical protein ACYS5V_04445 [Planctomycetota bacterium]|jgi:hypothetical protein
MEEKELRERLSELAEALTPLPPSSNARASKGSYVPHISQPSGRKVADILDHLRLRVKYLTFDLEATRRENRYLRQMLERRTNMGDGPDNT